MFCSQLCSLASALTSCEVTSSEDNRCNRNEAGKRESVTKLESLTLTRGQARLSDLQRMYLPLGRPSIADTQRQKCTSVRSSVRRGVRMDVKPSNDIRPLGWNSVADRRARMALDNFAVSNSFRVNPKYGNSPAPLRFSPSPSPSPPTPPSLSTSVRRSLHPHSPAGERLCLKTTFGHPRTC